MDLGDTGTTTAPLSRASSSWEMAAADADPHQLTACAPSARMEAGTGAQSGPVRWMPAAPPGFILGCAVGGLRWRGTGSVARARRRCPITPPSAVAGGGVLAREILPPLRG